MFLKDVNLYTNDLEPHLEITELPGTVHKTDGKMLRWVLLHYPFLLRLYRAISKRTVSLKVFLKQFVEFEDRVEKFRNFINERYLSEPDVGM